MWSAPAWVIWPAWWGPRTWPGAEPGGGLPNSRQPRRAAMADGVAVRVVSYNIHGQRDDRAALVEVVRGLAPDVLLVQEGPRRLRWRTRSADLANRCRLVYAAGGEPALGNVAMVSMRAQVVDTWCVQFPLTPGRHMRGAVF